jgi:UMF1 family MFS transporter
MNGMRSRSGSDSGSSLFIAPARYPGEDTRPTSPRELAGWYAYAFAAEVYVICGQLVENRAKPNRCCALRKLTN